MIEYLNFNSDGVKSLGNNLNTGFDINDYIDVSFFCEILHLLRTVKIVKRTLQLIILTIKLFLIIKCV